MTREEKRQRVRETHGIRIMLSGGNWLIRSTDWWLFLFLYSMTLTRKWRDPAAFWLDHSSRPERNSGITGIVQEPDTNSANHTKTEVKGCITHTRPAVAVSGRPPAAIIRPRQNQAPPFHQTSTRSTCTESQILYCCHCIIIIIKTHRSSQRSKEDSRLLQLTAIDPRTCGTSPTDSTVVRCDKICWLWHRYCPTEPQHRPNWVRDTLALAAHCSFDWQCRRLFFLLLFRLLHHPSSFPTSIIQSALNLTPQSTA